MACQIHNSMIETHGLPFNSHCGFHFLSKKPSADLDKAVRCIRNKETMCPFPGLPSQRLPFQYGVDVFRDLFGGIYQFDCAPHKLSNRLLQQRIMGTSQNQSVDAALPKTL